MSSGIKPKSLYCGRLSALMDMRIKLPSFMEIALETYVFQILAPKNIKRPSFMSFE